MSQSTIQQAISLQQKAEHHEALALYRAVLANEPLHLVALTNSAISLRKLGKYDLAKVYYSRALKLAENDALLWSNFGNLLCDMKLFGEANAAFGRAKKLTGESVDYLYNAGNVPFNDNQPEQAITFYDKALEIDSQHENARWNRSLSLLQLGDYLSGFSGYESRLDSQHEYAYLKDLPVWQGEDLNNKKILLCREQGLGDMLQFSRFAQCLKQQGAEVFMQASTPLRRFMFCVKGIDHVVDENYINPEIDYYLPVMSLPQRLKVELEKLPETHDYVNTAQFIAPRPLPGNQLLKVGIVWASKPGHPSNRSCDLRLLLPLLYQTGVDFYSFQKGESVVDIADLGLEGLLYDLDDYMPDFYDTAAYMKQMDLVISIDSSPLHCSAAIGVETWGLLLHAAEWRFLIDRSDSPWYPSLRLFRQNQHNDWSEVLEELFSAFAEFIHQKRSEKITIDD